MDTHGIDRRTFLRSATVSVLGAGLAGCGRNSNAAKPVDGRPPAALLRQNARGYYSWFTGGNTGFRAEKSFTYTQGDSQWMATSTAADGVRCLVKNVKTGTAGFELSLGALGDLETVRIGSRVETDGQGGRADETDLFYALYFDRDENETYYNWSTDPAGRQRFQGYGKDLEGVGIAPAGEPLTIDRGTELQLPRDNQHTLRKLQNGKIDAIGKSTPTALFVGVLGGGEGSRVAVIESLAINRRR